MPKFRSARRVGHRADQMFDLVADVESYPEFLPLCTGLQIHQRRNDPSGREVLISDMSVGYRGVSEHFTTRVTLDRPKHKILVEYVDGPFSHLENIWHFHGEGGSKTIRACRVEFFIDYEFRNKMLGGLMGSMFDSAFRKFAEAFEARADIVYGTGGAAE